MFQGRGEAQVIANGWRTDTRAQQERKQKKKTGLGPVWASPDVPDNGLPDGKTADEAVKAIEKSREKFAVAKFQQSPVGSPASALHANSELRAYALVQNVLLEKTVVVLWGDHGWHLGDHGLCHKHTDFERATRVPLFFSVPGQETAGCSSAALTEYVDLFPTLADVCGLPNSLGVKGVSFAPLLGNPGRPWKQTAFSQSRRQALGIGPVMGYSMRIECCRLTLWLTRDAGEEVDAELFDYEKDPAETDNLDKSTAHAKVVADLRAPFARGWRGAVPVRR